MVRPLLSGFPVMLAQTRRLPVRDGDVWMYAAAGVALLVVGALFIYLSRRRR